MGVEKDIIDGKTNETSWQKIVGVIVTCTGIIGMLVMIPQAISVWSGSAEGVSFFTWSFMLINITAWTLYGIAHKRVAIIIPNVVGLLVAGAVVVGLLVV